MARMGKGRGAPAASRGRHFSKPLGLIFPGSCRTRLEHGVHARPSCSPRKLTSQRSLGVAWVANPKLGTRQSRSPRPLLGYLHIPTPGAASPGSLRTHRAVRGSHAPPPPRCGVPSTAPSRPRPRPT